MKSFPVFLSDVVIGFSERYQRVREGEDISPGHDCHLTLINVTHSTASQRQPTILLHFEGMSSTATVMEYSQSTDGQYDAIFIKAVGDPGVANTSGIIDRLTFVLGPAELMRPVLAVCIRDDVITENRECLTVSISPEETSSDDELFTCNESETASNLFCEHTVCIEDNDGIYIVIIMDFLHIRVYS